jgi:hypothetical protein
LWKKETPSFSPSWLALFFHEKKRKTKSFYMRLNKKKIPFFLSIFSSWFYLFFETPTHLIRRLTQTPSSPAEYKEA